MTLSVRIVKSDLDKEMDRIVEDVKQFIFTRSQEIHIENGTPDTGFLLKSGRIEGNTIVYDAPYAEDIEYGTPPHFVPPGAIAGWAKRKLRLEGEEAWEAAHSISKKIAEEGTDPQPFIRPAIRDAQIRFKRNASVL